jgi:phage FluMu protein Com
MNEGFVKWFRCRKCNKPLLKLTEQSVVRNEIFCRCCKTSFQVDIEYGEVLKNEEIKQTK